MGKGKAVDTSDGVLCSFNGSPNPWGIKRFDRIVGAGRP